MSAKINKKDPDSDPCIQEQLESKKCMASFGYNRTLYKDKCKLVFDNVKLCKQFWSDVQKKRAEKSIKPSLPEKHEREKLKEILGDNLPYVAL